MDLNNFKPYNDYYGYAKGDEVIKQVASLLRGLVGTQGFLGHVGGDDYVAIFYGEDWQAICQAIVDSFSHMRNGFYTTEDVERGGILGKDRQGNEAFFELLDLAIAVVNPDVELCASHHQIAAMCSDAKKHTKALKGTRYFLSRRRH